MVSNTEERRKRRPYRGRGLSRMKRRVKFGAETNYNKRFRLIRWDRLRLCPLGEAVGATIGSQIKKHG
jgi:hypothetical protein